MTKARSIPFSLVLLSLVVGACQRSDTLSMQENAAGDREVHHTLLGSEGARQAICVMTSASIHCDEDAADVLVENSAHIDDVAVEWTNNRTILVTVRSGRVIRQAGLSRNGATRIEVARP